MQQHRRVEQPSSDERGQSTIEFALVLPLLMLCAASLVAVLSVCTSVLELNDMARVLARAASTSENPAQTVADLASQSKIRADTNVDPTTGIITVTAETMAHAWFLGSRLPPVTIRAVALILGEPQVVLGQ